MPAVKSRNKTPCPLLLKAEPLTEDTVRGGTELVGVVAVANAPVAPVKESSEVGSPMEVGEDSVAGLSVGRLMAAIVDLLLGYMRHSNMK
ncbi:unnamed protein product [Protopolystoma xenopodis]|uniref:Uncharacterized protein n=1 Tax=Protopolystoma xenopodis TaxID=117903 RepID=A0A448WNK6_9PLAT|nr:unnamed protein product [Protopolystoma xenopodis]